MLGKNWVFCTGWCPLGQQLCHLLTVIESMQPVQWVIYINALGICLQILRRICILELSNTEYVYMLLIGNKCLQTSHEPSWRCIWYGQCHTILLFNDYVLNIITKSFSIIANLVWYDVHLLLTTLVTWEICFSSTAQNLFMPMTICISQILLYDFSITLAEWHLQENFIRRKDEGRCHSVKKIAL